VERIRHRSRIRADVGTGNGTPAGFARVYEPLGPELERTLEVLIEHEFERGATAAALPVHRNTLRDRLHRIGELTGVQFDTASGQALAWLASRARRVGA
jgi:DNA-binding PucR family transcriptional regulator